MGRKYAGRVHGTIDHHAPVLTVVDTFSRPERHTLHDLVEFMGTIMDLTYGSDGFHIPDLRMSPLPWIKAGLVQYAPFGQRTFVGSTLEKLERSQLSDISQGYPSIAEMGVKLQTAKETLPWAIEPWRQNR